MREEWVTVCGHNDYEINKSGSIRKKGKERCLKVVYSNGYGKVILDGKTEYVSRLVAKTFLEDAESMEVLHKNKNNKDNRVSNLKWASHSEIEDHVLGPYHKMKKYSNDPKPVLVVETGEIYESVRSCAKHLMCEPSTIRKCLYHKNYTFKGLHFCLLEK